MLVLIKKDESTSVPREVADMAAARALLAEGMPVFVLNEDGTKTAVEEEGAEAIVHDEIAEASPEPIADPAA